VAIGDREMIKKDSIVFKSEKIYDSFGAVSKTITNAKEIFPLLMDDLKQAGYTQVSFNVAGDKIKDHESWNTNDKNKEQIDSFTGSFISPAAHHSIFVYPSLESYYSHIHSRILSKYDLIWGGGNVDNYSIKPEFSRELGACVFDLVDGEWKRQRRRWGKRFIELTSEFVYPMSSVSSDKDIQMIARICGFSKALYTRRDKLHNLLDVKPDYRNFSVNHDSIKAFALLHGPLSICPLYLDSKEYILKRIARHRLGYPVKGELHEYQK
jgi:hypothetical protein